MSLQVYNTLSGQKEAFVPLHPEKVTMYACGVTVYDYCHIGHARSAMVFDVIRRYLQYKGYEVVFAKNFTDVDDKIIKRSLEEGISAQEVAEKYIAAHNEDMGRLGIRPADIEPKATEHIDDMLAMIEHLVEQGIAYAVDGDVYFSVKKFSDYGKLSGRNVDDMRSGARIEVDERKQDPLDFAVWKASKPGEPSWKSPWGEGRPGWHIECSAMSCKYLGETFDIHGGGKDLIFPHHENEIAQAEAHTHKPFAKYWIHNGFVSINQEKMSKSLGNFFTIREVLEKFSPEAIRFLMLSTHYRSPLDYSDARLEEATTALKRFFNTFQAVEELQSLAKGNVSENDAAPAEQAAQLTHISDEVARAERAFEEAMDDDFNTAAAIGALFELLKTINSGVQAIAGEKTITPRLLQPLINAVERVKGLAGILGFTFSGTKQRAGAGQERVEQLMGLLLELRQEARTSKNWAVADRIRDGLAQIGIQVKDHPGGESTWKLES